MTKSLAIVNKSVLRPGQKKLYRLIVEKLDTGEKLTLAEAESIWLTDVHAHVANGQPHRWDYYAKRYDDGYGNITYSPKLVPMTQEEVTESVLLWLTTNIGRLVIRGYLKVIPAIDVKQLQD